MTDSIKFRIYVQNNSNGQKKVVFMEGFGYSGLDPLIL